MAQLQRLELGQKGIDYVRSSLANGNTLSRLLLETLELEKGQVATFLPAEIPESAIYEFSAGGKLPISTQSVSIPASDGSALRIVSTPTATPELAKHIFQYLQDDDRRVCVFESELAKASDPGLQAIKEQVLSFGQEVYHSSSHPVVSPDEIESMIANVQSFALVGVLAGAREHAWNNKATSELQQSELQFLASITQEIIVSAYDGESYLIWRKADT